MYACLTHKCKTLVFNHIRSSDVFQVILACVFVKDARVMPERKVDEM